MKALFTITCVLVLLTGRSQKQSFNWKSQALPAGLVFLSGATDGFNNALSFKWASVKKVFPGINQNYWWPSVSFQNKYKGGKKENGERFFGSSTVFVAVSDGWHLTRFFDHLFMAGALTCKVALWEKKRWYYYVLEGATYWIVNRIGFFTVYNVILK